MVTGAQRHKLFSIAFIVLFSLFITAQAFAASLTANVDRATVGAGESFRLELSLSGASAKGAPDFTPLEKDFTIVSKGQSSQTTIINNRVSSSINWQLVLIAPFAGDYLIPPLSVNTDEGYLESDPLKISVQKSSAPAPQAGANGMTGTAPKALSVQTDISTRTPYQNEPVLYTVKLVAARSVGDVGIPEFTVPDAVVEKLGDAKVYDARAGGAPVKVIEARYLITPLKSGKIKISPYIFRGQVVSDVQRGRRSLFNDPFFDMPDPFGMFESFGNFATTEPFAIAGDEVTLDVKAPAAAMDPWLPLYDLQISENLSGAEDARVGEPLTLSLTMVARGASGKVLPNLSDQIKENGDFKIYADKPEISENISKDGKTINGWRQESYTLIPQKSGSLTLPEVKVPWWNIAQGKIAYASVPARSITVAPGTQSQTSATAATNQKQDLNRDKQIAMPSAPSKNSSNSMGESKKGLFNHFDDLMGVMILCIVLLVMIVIILWRKLQLQQNYNEKTLPKLSSKTLKQSKISLSDIKKASTPESLKTVLQTYAHQHFGLPETASLMTIHQEIMRHSPDADLKENKSPFLDLDAALYANKEIDVEKIKTDVIKILKKTSRQVESNKSTEQKLNPS